MKNFICLVIAFTSLSAFSAVTCVTKIRTDSGSKVLSKKIVTGTYGSASGISADATKLYSKDGHTILAATRELSKGTEIMIAKAIPAKNSGSVYAVKSFGLESVRLTDNIITVSCSN